MTRRLNFWFFALLLIAGIPYYWYLLDPGSGGEPTKPVTIAQLRVLANSVTGPRPTAIRAEFIGYRMISRNMLVAGWGMRATRAETKSFELIFADAPPVVIDAGTTRAAAREWELKGFDQSAQDRVNRAVRSASHVIELADIPLRNGGREPNRRPGGAASVRDAVPYAIAPGVVVIPAPGLGHDTKLVYVRLGSDREYLFAGPAVRVRENLRTEHPPARAATGSEPPGIREEQRSWLITVNALRRQAPDMTVVTGLDPVDPRGVGKGFYD